MYPWPLTLLIALNLIQDHRVAQGIPQTVTLDREAFRQECKGLLEYVRPQCNTWFERLLSRYVFKVVSKHLAAAGILLSDPVVMLVEDDTCSGSSASTQE